VRCSWQKGRGTLPGFLDSITGVFEDTNISELPSHFPYATPLPLAAQLHICWPEPFGEQNCSFLLPVCRINSVVDMKGSAEN